MLKQVFRRLGIVRGADRERAARDRVPTRTASAGYRLSETCQIPRLATIYEQYFGYRTEGVFVEIGAFDGEYVSNTSGLADLGWRGFYVEPVPAFFERCRRRHAGNAGVKVFNLAIGDGKGKLKLQVAGALSTANPELADVFQTLPWAKSSFKESQEVEVDMCPMEEFLASADVPRGFEILSLDVEGYEWQVLRHWDISQWKPAMVLIELHDQNPDYIRLWDDCARIVDYFEAHAYRVIYKDFTNTIYVRRDLRPRGNAETAPRTPHAP